MRFIAQPIRVIILAHNQSHTKKIATSLPLAGHEFEYRLVNEKYQFVREMLSFVPDLIIAMDKVPCFSGKEALRLIRATYPEIPFILISDNTEMPMEQEASVFLPEHAISELFRYIDVAFDKHPEARLKTSGIRIMNQIRENISGLGQIRDFMDPGKEDSLSNGIKSEIESSINFLEKLSNSLKSVS